MSRGLFRRGGVAVAIAAVLALGTASPSQADTLDTQVMPVAVCNLQGHFGASTYNPFSAFANYCYDISFPLGFTVVGGLDVQGYCNAKHPGSKAVVVAQNPFGWVCRQKTR